MELIDFDLRPSKNDAFQVAADWLDDHDLYFLAAALRARKYTIFSDYGDGDGRGSGDEIKE